jgi:hypothetical protein
MLQEREGAEIRTAGVAKGLGRFQRLLARRPCHALLGLQAPRGWHPLRLEQRLQAVDVLVEKRLAIERQQILHRLLGYCRARRG